MQLVEMSKWIRSNKNNRIDWNQISGFLFQKVLSYNRCCSYTIHIIIRINRSQCSITRIAWGTPPRKKKLHLFHSPVVWIMSHRGNDPNRLSESTEFQDFCWAYFTVYSTPYWANDANVRCPASTELRKLDGNTAIMTVIGETAKGRWPTTAIKLLTRNPSDDWYGVDILRYAVDINTI